MWARKHCLLRCGRNLSATECRRRRAVLPAVQVANRSAAAQATGSVVTTRGSENSTRDIALARQYPAVGVSEPKFVPPIGQVGVIIDPSLPPSLARASGQRRQYQCPEN